ncbi:MAG: YolD-like family protein [Tenericutes bacterium]|nr:YolD-like family protein [Mycoplasmatota bacterium]
MLRTYQDRGIVKWSAFDALNGFNSMLKEMKYRLGKINKPILSSDDFEKFNLVLKEALFEEAEIAIKYYENGYSKTTFGKVDKLDFNEKKIILTTKERINAFDVLQIDIA